MTPFLIPVAWMLAGLLAFHLPVSVQGPAERCWCAPAAAVDGWCQKCRVGYFATVRVESRALYDALDSHGHEVRAELTRCGRCRELIAAGGFCEDCQMGYVKGVGYFGRLGYHTALGERVGPEALREMREAGPDAEGWCAAKGLGVVGNRVFRARADFARARQYVEILKAACEKAKACEDCALAMVADARCPFCSIEYFEGLPRKGR